MKFEDLKVTVYADGADIEGMKEEYRKGYVKGFTTNPTLMKKAGVKDYMTFAKEALKEIPDLPLSLEVFADDFETMEKEAKVLSSLSDNVFVKIPITNSKGESSIPLIKKLSEEGIRLNVTAILTLSQVRETVDAFKEGTENIVSVFAGRILDTGVDAMPIMKEVSSICREKPGTLSLWASCREVYNIIQADQCGVDIITVTNAILAKLPNLGKDLTKLSLETVQMFVNDGKSLGFSIL
ncbi:MAG: transaldolase [Lachnospiraceae bacterium]|nr:transaldolase [Lachnospiraceae bacterium]